MCVFYCIFSLFLWSIHLAEHLWSNPGGTATGLRSLVLCEYPLSLFIKLRNCIRNKQCRVQKSNLFLKIDGVFSIWNSLVHTSRKFHTHGETKQLKVSLVNYLIKQLMERILSIMKCIPYHTLLIFSRCTPQNAI